LSHAASEALLLWTEAIACSVKPVTERVHPASHSSASMSSISVDGLVVATFAQ
jgi:hypothetical protein